MQKYHKGQLIYYSAELFLIKGRYKRLYKEGQGIITVVHPDGFFHVWNGIRYALVHRTDIEA